MIIQYWSLDFFVILFYFFIILYVGINAGRNITTFKDFAISRKNFSTPTIIATIFATAVGGGSTLGLAERAFSVGIIFLLPPLGNFLGYIIYSYIILHSKMLFNNKSLSVGELVGKLYGNTARVITGILAICVSLGYLGAQISSMGYIFNYFFDIPFIWGVVLGYSIVIIYTTFGGIRSVVFTDVIQFGVMIVAIPLLCTIGISQIGGMSNFIDSIPIKNLSLVSNKITLAEIIVSCIVVSFVGFNPAFIQRLLIVKDNRQAFYSIFITSIITIPFFILVVGIGFISLSMNANINPNFAFLYLIDRVIPLGIKGFVIAGLLSAMMSTIDSGLNLIGICSINDIFIPLTRKRLSGQQNIKIARIVTFLFSLLSIVIPLYFDNLFDIILFSTSFWAPTIFIPLLLAFLGMRVSSRSFFVCLFCGLSSMLLYNYCTGAKYGAGQIVGTAVNLITFILCYINKDKSINSSTRAKNA